MEFIKIYDEQSLEQDCTHGATNGGQGVNVEFEFVDPENKEHEKDVKVGASSKNNSSRNLRPEFQLSKNLLAHGKGKKNLNIVIDKYPSIEPNMVNSKRESLSPVDQLINNQRNVNIKKEILIPLSKLEERPPRTGSSMIGLLNHAVESSDQQMTHNNLQLDSPHRLPSSQGTPAFHHKEIRNHIIGLNFDQVSLKLMSSDTKRDNLKIDKLPNEPYVDSVD